MTDASARYQSLDGEARVVQNLVYNPSSGNWELEQQGVIEAVTGNLYLAVDEIESKMDSAQAVLVTIDQAIDDQLKNYKMDDYDVSAATKYVGYQNKAGNYYIKRINTSTGAVDYSYGASGYSTAWTNRATESYNDFATEF